MGDMMAECPDAPYFSWFTTLATRMPWLGPSAQGQLDGLTRSQPARFAARGSD
jgi:hypothetical protein